MSNEKRFVLFVVLMFAWLLGFPYLFKFWAWTRRPKKPPRRPMAQGGERPGRDALPAAKRRGRPRRPRENGPPRRRRPPTARTSQPRTATEQPKPDPQSRSSIPASCSWARLTDRSPTGYRLEVQLDQKGAGVESVSSSAIRRRVRGPAQSPPPLQLIRRDPVWPPSLALTLAKDPWAQRPARPTRAEEEDDAGDRLSSRPRPRTCWIRSSGTSFATPARSSARSPGKTPRPSDRSTARKWSSAPPRPAA